MLVEKPVAGTLPMMGRFDFEKPSMSASMTLPRLADASSSKTKQQPKKPTRLDISAPRAMLSHTLPPPRLANLSTSPAEPDTNPLRILRDKNYPIVRPRVKCTVPLLPPPPVSAAHDPPIDHSDQDGICESPSYLTQAECNFNDAATEVSTSREIENLNPIPLPPRDRNKPMPINVKRHVRKYPLIIPATGLQRTLNKVVTPVEEHEAPTFPNDSTSAATSVHSVNQNRHSSPYKQDTTTYAKRFIENNFPDQHDRTYENMESMRGFQTDCTDSASLHFESILEDGDSHVADVMASPDVTGDFMFEINKEHKAGADCGKDASVRSGEDADDILGNLDIEQKKLAFSQRYPKYVQPPNELANNIMFNKLKESAEATAVTEVGGRSRGRPMPLPPLNVDEVDGAVGGTSLGSSALAAAEDDDGDDDYDAPGSLHHSNSVSCEDLLEFSDQKPKGRERGVESDEVRIMTKVLGNSVCFPLQFQYTLLLTSFLLV